MLTSHTQVIQLGRLDTDLDQDFIEEYIELAKTLEMQPLIGDDEYSEYESAEASDADKVKLARAEAFFTLEKMLPVLNVRISSEGGLQATVGFGDSESRLLSQDEMDKLCSRFRELASEIVGAYLDVDEVADDSMDTGNLGLSAVSARDETYDDWFSVLWP